MIKKSLLFMSILLILSFNVFASQLISYQGRVGQSGNSLQNGNLTIFIYAQQNGGSPVWNQTYINSIKSGYFDVVLGNDSLNALNLVFGTHYYLDMDVNNQNINWSGKDRIEFESNTGSITISVQNQTGWIKNGNFIYLTNTDDKVGIGTINPTTKLHINSTDGLIIPIGNNSQRQNQTGLIRFNNQLFQFEGYTGYDWASLGGVVINNTIIYNQTMIINNNFTINNTFQNIINTTTYVYNSNQTTINSTTYIYNTNQTIVNSNTYMNNSNITLINGYINSTTIYASNFNGDNLTIKGFAHLATTNGNVGIGTTNPNVKLHINSSNNMFKLENIDGTTPNQYAQMELKAGTADNYIWTNNQNSVGFYGGSNSLNIYGGSNSPIAFFTNAIGTPRMFIGTSGNIGIGTTNPSYKLDINGSAWNNINRIYSTGSSTGTEYFWNSGTRSGVVYGDTNGFGLLSQDTSWALRLTDSAAQIYHPLTVDSSLTVGGPIYRSVAGAGYLNGQYSSVESTTTSGAIYSIGGAYVPTSTTLGNMYGIGYGYSGNAGITFSGLPNSLWGMYVASGGAPTIFLSSGDGKIYSTSVTASSTANPGLNVGDGATGYVKFGGATLSSSGGSVTIQIG